MSLRAGRVVGIEKKSQSQKINNINKLFTRLIKKKEGTDYKCKEEKGR